MMVETFLDLALSTSLSSPRWSCNPSTQEEEKKAEAEREAREMKEQSCNKVQNSKLQMQRGDADFLLILPIFERNGFLQLSSQGAAFGPEQ